MQSASPHPSGSKLNAAGQARSHTLYLGMGSNIAPQDNLPRAFSGLSQFLEIHAVSSVWETAPVGGEGQNFLNAVVHCSADLPANTLREQHLRPLETRLGRVRSADPNAPRPIDLDILVFDGHVLEPEIWEQAHWAIPLAELLPGLTHPLTEERLIEIARRLGAETHIHRFQGALLGKG